VCWGFYLRTWIEALNAAGVDQALELRDPKKVFYPLAIKVKVATPAKGSTAPSIPLASTESSDPTPNDKAPTVPPTFSEKEGPALKKMGSSHTPPLKGKIPKRLRRIRSRKNKGKSCQSKD